MLQQSSNRRAKTVRNRNCLAEKVRKREKLAWSTQMHPCVALYKYLTVLYKIFSYFQGRNASQVTVLLALFQQIFTGIRSD